MTSVKRFGSAFATVLLTSIAPAMDPSGGNIGAAVQVLGFWPATEKLNEWTKSKN
jgi:hypothetical protein